MIAETLVEHGPALVDTLHLMAELARRGEVSLAAEPLDALIDEAEGLLIRWYAGEQLTARADEAERRARSLDAWGPTGHDDPLALRLGALALLRLPPESEERDLESARRRLLTSLELGRRADDLNEQLATMYYLLKYELLSPEQSVALMEEACASLTGNERPSALRDFLESAHRYCLVHAGEGLMVRDVDSHTSWMERATGLLGIALGEYERTEFDIRITGMVARHLDIAGDAHQAAVLYGRLIDQAADTRSRTTQALALSEATLLGHTGAYERVRERMVQFLPCIRDRYLAAVTEHDVAQAAFSFNRASALLALAHVHCGEPEAALRVLEDSKSLRRHYRSALSQLPSHKELLALEQDILAATRAHEISHAVADSSPPAVPGRPISLLAQLLERYRRLRPDLPAEALRSPSAEEIAAALGPDEAAVILGVGDSATLVFYLTRDTDRSRPALHLVCLPEWPWDRWQELLDVSGGWIDALSGRLDSHTSQAALRTVVPAVEAAIGQLVKDKVMGQNTRRLVVIPHRWLHFVPFRAMPSLLDTPMSIYPSSREFVQSRTRPSPPATRADLVVCDPTGDLPCSATEAGSARFNDPTGRWSTVLIGRDATSSHVAEHLAQAGAFHFSGHGHADPQDPARSALLMAPSPNDVRAGDPFPDWVVRAPAWKEIRAGESVADLPGIGRLRRRTAPSEATPDTGAGDVELWMERGARGTLYARYAGRRLRILGELWSAGDVLGRSTTARFAFLSACRAGMPGAIADADEFGGVPASLLFHGADAVVCPLWPVSDGFAALYTELFYTRHTLCPEADVATLVCEVARTLRKMGLREAISHVVELAERVRIQSPIAALALEAYADDLRNDRQEHPFSEPWFWAAFTVLGGDHTASPT